MSHTRTPVDWLDSNGVHSEPTHAANPWPCIIQAPGDPMRSWGVFDEMSSTTDEDDILAFGHQACDFDCENAPSTRGHQACDFDFENAPSTRYPLDDFSLAVDMGEDLFVASASFCPAAGVCTRETRVYPEEDHSSSTRAKAVAVRELWMDHRIPAPSDDDTCASIAETLSCFAPQPLSGSPGSLALQVKPRIRRRKMGLGDKHSLGGRPQTVISGSELTPVVFTPETLQHCFGMPLHEAARTLGICATAVKKCCRRMGIKQWPFQSIKPIRTRLARLRSAPMTSEIQLEIEHLQAEEAALLQGQGLSCLDPSA